MQAEITAHVVRLANTNEIVDIESISDMYSEVCVTMYATQVSEAALISWLKRVWGSNWAKMGASMLKSYCDDGFFVVQGEAKDMPDLGNYICRIETKTVDWE